MKKKNNLNQLYKLPLPINARPLPPAVLHNPLSVLYYIWDYMFPIPTDRICCKGSLSGDGTFVKVLDEKDMDALWSMGFFGKGILSRSEPTWYTRTARRLKLEGGDKITAEDITNARRIERKKFKQERAKADREELERRRALDLGQSAASATHEPMEPMEEFQNKSPEEEPEQHQDSREEDKKVIKNGKLLQMEHLQLTPSEAVFLSYGLGALQVDDLTPRQVFDHFVHNDARFLHSYIAYHHYRSKGWCARSGVKFGTDLLLYKRGPPFSHAEFAVMVMPVGTEEESQSWWWKANIGRVVGGVKKTLVFCYVSVPNREELSSMTIDEILEASFVREVVYRRWIPTRNRD